MLPAMQPMRLKTAYSVFALKRMKLSTRMASPPYFNQGRTAMNKESPIIRTVNIGEDYPVFRVVDGKEVQISKEELRRPHRTVCDIATGTTRIIELTDEEMAEQQAMKAAWNAGISESEEQQRRAEEEERKFQESLHYEERLVAFIDILGWKAAINASENNLEMVKALGNALSPLRNFAKYTGQLNSLMPDTGWHGEPMMSQFSDCVVLSVKDDSSGRTHLLQALQVLSLSIAHFGYFLRGGVVKGDIYHKNGLVFGPALVKAYELERDIACYPRIILSDEMARNLGDWGNAMDIPWKYDEDGKVFFNFMPPFMGNQMFFNSHELWQRILNPIRDLIIKNSIEFQHDEKLSKKYQWLARYFNATCSENPNCGVTLINETM